MFPLASLWFLVSLGPFVLYCSTSHVVTMITMITKITIITLFNSSFCDAFFCQITIKEHHCKISECKNTNHSIIDVIAKSNSSVIHYLWSVIGSPTIIAAYFEKTDVDLTLNWTEILNKDSKEGIQFLEVITGDHITPNYVTAFVIPAIYEFQDPKDELFYTRPDVKGIKKHSFQTKSVLWESPAVDHKHNMTTFKASMLGGSVIFQVS